jgi:hypothetical protein
MPIDLNLFNSLQFFEDNVLNHIKTIWQEGDYKILPRQNETGLIEKKFNTILAFE